MATECMSGRGMLSILKCLIKHYIKDEGGWMLMAGMAAASLVSAHEQRKAQMKAKVGDAKLQRARLEKARTRASGDYATNSQRAREAAQSREIQIEENRLQAESAIDSTFAGSGIGGTSVNQLDDELEASAAKNKMQNKKALDTQLSDINKNYSNTMNDSSDQAASIDTTAVKGSFLNDAMGAASAAASVQSLDAGLVSALGSFGGAGGGGGGLARPQRISYNKPSNALGINQRST